MGRLFAVLVFLFTLGCSTGDAPEARLGRTTQAGSVPSLRLIVEGPNGTCDSASPGASPPCEQSFVFGQSVTLRAIVSGAYTPNDAVNIDWAGSIVSCDLAVDGTCSVVTNQSAPNPNTVPPRVFSNLKVYYAGVTSPANAITVRMYPATTKLTLTSSVNPAQSGAPVMYTVQAGVQGVGGHNAGLNGIFEGTFHMFSDGVEIGTAKHVVGDSEALWFMSYAPTAAELAAGSHTITARLDSAFPGQFTSASTDGTNGSSGPLTQVVNAPTTTTVSSTTSLPAPFGTAVSLHATVAGGPPDCVACIAFSDNVPAPSTPLGTANLSGGVATLTAASLGVGPHSITATYSGATGFAASSSSSFPFAIGPAGATVAGTITTAPAGLVYGGVFSLDVTVTGTATAPTGTVSISAGGPSSAPVALAAGAARFSSTALADRIQAGPATITIAYSGDGTYPAGSASIQLTMLRAPSSASLLSSANPSVAGQGISVSTLVSAAFDGTPTGEVTFVGSGASLGTVALGGGAATLLVSNLARGQHTIVVSYPGDANFLPCSSALVQTVNGAMTTTMLVASVNPALPGVPVSFGVSVLPVAPATGTPSGTVTLLASGTTLGTATLAGGQASFQAAGFAAGAHVITARYEGESSFDGSTSDPLSLSVTTSATVIEVSASPSSPLRGQLVTFTARLSSAAGFPTGTVRFTDGTGTTLGTEPLDSSGVASLSTAALAAGTHGIGVVYGGDGKRLGGTGGVAIVVRKRPTTLNLAQSTAQSAPGDAVTFSATLASDAGPVSGLVTFEDNGVAIGDPLLASGGTATLTISTLFVGSHAITATFAGDADSSASASSPALVHIVTHTPDTDGGPLTTPPSSPSPPATTTAPPAPEATPASDNEPIVGATKRETGGCSGAGRPISGEGALLAFLLLLARRRRGAERARTS